MKINPVGTVWLLFNAYDFLLDCHSLAHLSPSSSPKALQPFGAWKNTDWECLSDGEAAKQVTGQSQWTDEWCCTPACHLISSSDNEDFGALSSYKKSSWLPFRKKYFRHNFSFLPEILTEKTNSNRTEISFSDTWSSLYLLPLSRVSTRRDLLTNDWCPILPLLAILSFFFIPNHHIYSA